jgi:sodium/proline symporter
MIFSFVIALVCVVFAGWWAGRRAGQVDQDYYLAGRSYGPVVIGVSTGAAGNSGFLMIGSVGLGYLGGLSALALPLGIFIGDWCFWTFLARPVYEATPPETNTVPERLAQRAGQESWPAVRILAALILLICLCFYAAAQLTAIGISIESAFTVNSSLAIVLYVALVGSYTAVGGFRSSVMASLIHGAIMLATALIAVVGVIFALLNTGDASDAVRLALLSGSQGPAATDFNGFILRALGYAVFGVCIGLGLPTILVKVFALRDIRRIGQAKWIYLLFSYGIQASMVVLGIMLHVLVPDIENPELGLLEFSRNYLSPVITGVVLAGVVAAISSTFESLLVVLSSAVGSDLLGGPLSRLSAPLRRRAHTLITALVAVAVTSAALTNSSTVFDLVIYSVSCLLSAIGPVMVVTTFRWRTSSTALIWTMISGFLVSIAWIATGLNDILNSVLPAFATALLIHSLISRKTSRGH